MIHANHMTPTPDGGLGTVPMPMAPSTEETNLIETVKSYQRPGDVEHVRRVLDYARELRELRRLALLQAPTHTAKAEKTEKAARGEKAEKSEKAEKAEKTEKIEKTEPAGQAKATAIQQDFSYVLGVAQTLADAIHIDAISLAAVLLYQAVENKQVSLDDVRMRLAGEFGEAVAQTIANIERFDSLQRPREELRRHAAATETEETTRDRRRSRERQRQQDAENLRKMFVAMTEDPRVAVFKIADQLRLMRAVREAADYWYARDKAQLTQPADALAAAAPQPAPQWTADECRMMAEETRDIYAPLAGRLGMGRVEGELEDLAFAVLEPDDYAWLSDAVANYIQERGAYVERVCDILRKEMRAIGLNAEISGRVKHLYSITRRCSAWPAMTFPRSMISWPFASSWRRQRIATWRLVMCMGCGSRWRGASRISLPTPSPTAINRYIRRSSAWTTGWRKFKFARARCTSRRNMAWRCTGITKMSAIRPLRRQSRCKAGCSRSKNGSKTFSSLVAALSGRLNLPETMCW